MIHIKDTQGSFGQREQGVQSQGSPREQGVSGEWQVVNPDVVYGTDVFVSEAGAERDMELAMQKA